MKKIRVTVSLLAMLITMACNTSKNSVANLAPPLQPVAPAKPQKGEMNETTDMKAVPNYEKKILPKKGKLQPMEAVSLPDTLVSPRNR